ncbi:hypothetical protein IM40_04865 [Candidatus Paracaedimonas acanthamoebae]|nr:hypothetical protein IM40_04865 [Candidatus Paracaedimonas acanthamoebae]
MSENQQIKKTPQLSLGFIQPLPTEGMKENILLEEYYFGNNIELETTRKPNDQKKVILEIEQEVKDSDIFILIKYFKI